jgi:hypothetical protein
MRRVVKDAAAVPAKFLEASVQADLEAIALGDKTLISDTIYKATYKQGNSTKSATRDQLNLFYKQKCGYCEKFCKAEIEHYRPKKGVNEDPGHGGYYWLCYEWTNLIPSCRYCNTEGGKGNQFPVLGSRVNAPPFAGGALDRQKCLAHENPLHDEKPFLLHPEIDHPELFLECTVSADKSGIDLFGIDGEGRGEKTIGICNLNRADLAIDRRSVVVQPAVKAFSNMLQMINLGMIPEPNIEKVLGVIFDSLNQDAMHEEKNFTFVRKSLILSASDFTRLTKPFFSSEDQFDIILAAFQSWKASNP